MLIHLINNRVNELYNFLNEIAMAKTFKIGRDAGTGKFIPLKVAEKKPKTTVVETIKKK